METLQAFLNLKSIPDAMIAADYKAEDIAKTIKKEGYSPTSDIRQDAREVLTDLSRTKYNAAIYNLLTYVQLEIAVDQSKQETMVEIVKRPLFEFTVQSIKHYAQECINKCAKTRSLFATKLSALSHKQLNCWLYQKAKLKRNDPIFHF